jgi:hypothetical protein
LIALSLHGPVRAGDSPQPRIQVGTVFGTPIYADELEPGPSEPEPRGLAPEQREQWRQYVRKSRLTTAVWRPLVERYCQSHPCEPSTDEIDRFIQALERSKHDRAQDLATRRESLVRQVQDPGLDEDRKRQLIQHLYTVESLLRQEDADERVMARMSPEVRAALEAEQPAREREIAAAMISSWKFNKALYGQHGGAVIFQQAGIEPLGAYRTFLEEHEKNGSFTITDPQLRAEFWEYFISDKHNVIPVDEKFQQETGLKHPFEQPWWLLPPKDTRP